MDYTKPRSSFSQKKLRSPTLENLPMYAAEVLAAAKNSVSSNLNNKELLLPQRNSKKEGILVYAFIFIRLLRYKKLFQIRRKRNKHRKYVIKELIETEDQYVSSLNLLLTQLMPRQAELSLLTKEEFKAIFSNLESIYAFNKEFLSIMKLAFTNFTNSSPFALNLVKMLDFFKLYFPYCDHYQESTKFLEKLRLAKHPFTEWIKQLEYTPELQNLDFSSQLIKPVQRLPKYVLLFKDLMKNTDRGHVDYENIEKCLVKFQEINNLNNLKMNETLKSMKMKELDEKFGQDKSLLIVQPQREFLEEEALSIVLDNQPSPVVCYFFNDLILVVENIKGVSSLIRYQHLDHQSHVEDKPNHQYFQWIFSVHGKDLILTFSAHSKEAKKSMMNFIQNKIIQVLCEKAELKINAQKQFLSNVSETLLPAQNYKPTIQVLVVGTIKRGNLNISPYTVYVIEVRYKQNNEKIMSRLFFRYSQLLKLDELLKNDFAQININHLPPKHWFKSNRSEIVESRKLLIENFLQSVLSNRAVVEGKEFKVLDFLGLPRSFMEVYGGVENKMEKSLINLESVLDFEQTNKVEEKFGRVSVYTTLAASHKSVKKINRKVARLHDQASDPSLEFQKVSVKLMNGQTILIKVNKHTKALEACMDIAHQIQLHSYLDFKLFLCNKKDMTQNRNLDDDEYLIQALDMQDNNEGYEKKFIEKVKTGIEIKWKNFIQKFSSNVEYEVVYMKYLYLSIEVEENDIKKDPVKLELVAEQIFKEINLYKYILTFEDYSLIASLQAFIKYGSYNDNQDDLFLPEKIKQIFPSSIFSRKDDRFWMENISRYWGNISYEIQRLTERSAFNKLSERVNERMSSSKKKEEIIYFDDKMLAKMVAINSMKKHSLYGSALFWVDVHKKSDKPPFAIPKSLFIGVKVDGVTLLTPETKETMIGLKYEEIETFQAYPGSVIIEFKINEEKQIKLRFKTTQSFEIYQLIEEYGKLRKVMTVDKNEEEKNG